MTPVEAITLIEGGLFSYGYQTTRAEVLLLGGYSEPNYHSLEGVEAIRESKKYDLILLGIYSALNDQLLLRGRTLRQVNGDFMVPGINETLKHASSYEKRASKNMLKARKLKESFRVVNPTEEPTFEETRAEEMAHRLQANQSNVGR